MIKPEYTVAVVIGIAIVTYLPRMLPIVVMHKLKLPPLADWSVWQIHPSMSKKTALLLLRNCRSE